MKNKGITLISLVITIIVLLILAGVTISSLNGDNGIIKKAGEAKEKVEIETEKEILGTTYIEASKRFKKGKIEKTIFETKLENNKGNKNTNVIENGETIVVKFTDTNRYYEIDNKGNIEGPNSGASFVIRNNSLLQIGNKKLFVNRNIKDFNEEQGNKLAREVVETMKNWIQEENPNRPLSDNKISKRFAEHGIKISRRSITKYREEASILNQYERKKEKTNEPGQN